MGSRPRHLVLLASHMLVACAGDDGPNAAGIDASTTGQAASSNRDGATNGSGASTASSSGGASSSSAGGSGAAAGNDITGGRTGPVPPFEVDGGYLVLEVCTDSIIRVTFSQDENFASRTTLATAPKDCDPKVVWSLEDTDTTATLTTARLSAVVELASGRVSFVNAAGETIVSERSRSLTPVDVQGDNTFNVQQLWEPNDDESFYGLGQHQEGFLDIKGYPLSLVQYNTQIVVPVFVSSRGYGILWDNTSWTRWGNLADFVSLNDNGGDYQGTFTADAGGDYIFQTYSSGQIELDIDGETVIEHWRQGWLPGRDTVKVPLQAGESVSLSLSFTSDIDVDIADLRVLAPESDPATSIWSEVGEGVDYYFVYGPDLDDVVGGYRRVTGQAPMMPKWAFGLWQCRERYTRASEVIDVLGEFRERGIPIDNIVQDWQYWVPGTWGSHEFDSSRFPDPAGWIQQIHDEFNAQLMISVWPKFHTGTSNYDELNDAGFIYPRNAQDHIEDFNGYEMGYYDAFNPDARAMFWSQMDQDLFALGVDAWWMDATEPEVVEGPYESPTVHRQLYQDYMHPTALGTGSRMLNAYSLVNSMGVYDGQRSAAPNQRVFILTRSGFAGQQRYASASWSGDITSTWTAFKKQIPAGLGFSLSGIPYWTVDTGGFAVPTQFRSGDSEEWYELNTRWFQYSTFLPLLRVHGQAPVREMWTMGGDQHVAYQTHVKFDRLRYRLLPYIYSLAGEVTQNGGTILRPLVMDFQSDRAVREVSDQYMFGPAFLVNPVTTYRATSRQVVLPETAGGWYDFWTGETAAGGQTINAPAPLDSMPLYVRAGSIVPVGPELEYTLQAPADPITLYVYTGADGAFTLYEDDGVSYAYEGGAFSKIGLSYDEASSTLTIDDREGAFDGMLSERTFDVIFVTPDSPVGFSFEPMAQTNVTYSGSRVTVTPP